MDPNGGPPNETTPSLSPQPLRRRLSMEEDYFYQEVMTLRRVPSQPPTYDIGAVRRSATSTSKREKTIAPALEGGVAEEGEGEGEEVREEVLPSYKCDLEIEGAFQLKMEIEEAVKRAEYRNWRTVIVQLRGTALNIYRSKKDWGWRNKSKGGPDVSPDSPPWLRKTKLEKTYSLSHADVGIAADYHKRRYVIRVRAETDQFLLSCIELPTFVKWLDVLFAAIEVAAPIDDRDFPRDQSIPRIQRLRWFRGQHPQPVTAAVAAAAAATSSTNRARDGGEEFPRLIAQQSAPDQTTIAAMSNPEPATEITSAPTALSREAGAGAAVAGPSRRPAPVPTDAMGRLSTTSYPNPGIDPETGKWRPRHQWTTRHDMVYAKLCYAVLLFKSPRKSNYIIAKGKQWFIDWTTGKMVRVLPPGYDDPEFFGPWQVIRPENARL